jgi:ribonuclease R
LHRSFRVTRPDLPEQDPTHPFSNLKTSTIGQTPSHDGYHPSLRGHRITYNYDASSPKQAIIIAGPELRVTIETNMKKAEQRIIDHLSVPKYKPVKWHSLSKKLDITKKQCRTHREALDRLLESGVIKKSNSGRLRLIGKTDPNKRQSKAANIVTGTIKRTGKGDGYLVPHERTPQLNGEDVFIAARDMQDAHTGDEVAVQLLNRRRSSGHCCGQIDQILERASNTFVGTYYEEAGQGFVRVDGKTFAEPVAVGDPGAKGAQPQDKVVIDMLRFPSLHSTGEAVLTQVLGARGEPGIDLLTIIHEFGLPNEFPESVLADASEQAELFDENDLSDRLDLTNDNVITIDPIDARDFDDAISLEISENGHWNLGVHIADVAHFVPTGGSLDIEAQKRGTSVYLPNKVLPMLPEVISNGLASLQQGKVRYVKSVFIEYTAGGIPVHTRFANAAIKVSKRFAYEQVMPIINHPDKRHKGVTKNVSALLTRMYELAMVLRKRRFANGALQMGLPEVKIDFDKKGHVIGAHRAEHDESHEIIEEFMLAANIAVAVKFTDSNIGFLRRSHGDPSEPKLKAFSDFVSVLGFDLPQYQSRKALQELLDSVKETPQSQAVNYAFLRSLKQAEYSPMDIGHYALAEDNYCHFTSPIRRYPDLTIHRQFDELVRRKSRNSRQLLNEAELMKLGRHCSSTARRAERAERELKRLKLLEYMSDHIGDELDAIITGVQAFGLFAQTVGIPAEGLVHVSSLTNDTWIYDSESYSLIGQKSGNQFQLGDRIRVTIVRVDVDRRELDLRLVKVIAKAQKPSTKKKSTKKKLKKKTGPSRSQHKPNAKGRSKSRRSNKSDSHSHGSKKSVPRKKSATGTKRNRRST